MLLDASEPISEQDQRVIGMAVDAGRALVIAFNKWDLVDEDRRAAARQGDRARARPRRSGRRGVNVSRADRPRGRQARARRCTRRWRAGRPASRPASSTRWIGELVAQTPPPVRSGKQPKILFATQAGTRPPRFVLFTSGFLEAGYRRFVERRLREDFGFVGSPIEVSVKVREKRSR